MLGNSSSSELTQTLEQAVRKGWSLFHWQYLQAGWTPICWEGFRRAVLQDCLSGSLQPHISPFVFPLSNHSAGTDRAVQALEMLCQRPRGRSSTKRKSVQIYYLYSAKGREALSIRHIPSGSCLLTSLCSSKMPLLSLQETSERKTCQGQCGFWSFAALPAFLSHFSGTFWEPMYHRLEDVCDSYMSWVHVPSRVTESEAKLRDPILLICLTAEVPAHNSASGHVKMPPVLTLHRAVLLLRHPFLSCPGKVERTSNEPPAAQ